MVREEPTGDEDFAQHREHTNISSFDAFDQLVAALLSRQRFPNLEEVTVAGHSAGGQYVQRWALLTPFHDDIRVRSVVANPSSYAYLTNERYDEKKQEWFVPGSRQHCELYNQWEWGLGPDQPRLPSVTPLYVRNVLRSFNLSELTQRFGRRHVTYLVGGLDVCNVSTTDDGWCDSHGLETTCMDQLQGEHRRSRHWHYVESLHKVDIRHRHAIVPGVGHDHSLMFHSPEGVEAILGAMGPPPVRETSN